MSLESLRSLRRQGHRPGVVWVIVGNAPAWLDDGADTVTVRPGANPRFMDLRPLVGLDVDIIELARDDALMASTMDAVEAADARVIGVVGSAGVTARSTGHERVLQKARELLCRA